jgi:DNA-binding response OmpR family regulator
MSATSPDGTQVLIAEDEEQLADLYHRHLNHKYDVQRAYGGLEAVEKIDEAVDVVLLDRRMPDLSGDDVLARIRREQYNIRAVMVTAVEPKTDIVDMEFDDYLKKPVDKETLVEAVEHQQTVRQYDETVQELSQVRAKMAAFEEEAEGGVDRSTEEYQDLKEKFERLKSKEREMYEELEYFEAAATWES